jgi:predicted transcriptional regulator
MQTNERFSGKWQKLPATLYRFNHRRRFPGTYKFALQWQGQHLSVGRIGACLDFLLLEHTCLDAEGKPVRLTAHAFRHGLATYLRNKGIALEDIARLLHQINTAVTAYYSDPSKHDLYTLVGPSLTELDQLTGNLIDPMTIRAPADIESHIQSALGKFGMLCHLSGGYCTSLQSCEVHFRCAACSSFAPDPLRRQEVAERVALFRKHVLLDEASGDLILMKVHRAQQRDWERVLFGIDALVAVPLTTQPLAEKLAQVGVKNIAGPSATIDQHFPKLLPEGGT